MYFPQNDTCGEMEHILPMVRSRLTFLPYLWKTLKSIQNFYLNNKSKKYVLQHLYNTSVQTTFLLFLDRSVFKKYFPLDMPCQVYHTSQFAKNSSKNLVSQRVMLTKRRTNSPQTRKYKSRKWFFKHAPCHI